MPLTLQSVRYRKWL